MLQNLLLNNFQPSRNMKKILNSQIYKSSYRSDLAPMSQLPMPVMDAALAAYIDVNKRSSNKNYMLVWSILNEGGILSLKHQDSNWIFLYLELFLKCLLNTRTSFMNHLQLESIWFSPHESIFWSLICFVNWS